MEEERPQSASMEFKPWSYEPKPENNYRDVSELSQQAPPPSYFDFLSRQSRLSEHQTLIPYNDLNNQRREARDVYFSGVLHSRSTVEASTPDLPFRRIRSDSSKQKAREASRRRRATFVERQKALQELLPQSKQGHKTCPLEAAADHIKHLQSQIKELSQNRLRGASTPGHFVFLEGYGDYLLQEHTLNEPLEESVGKLLEQNPSAAIELLESKGLYLFPMTLVQGSSQGV